MLDPGVQSWSWGDVAHKSDELQRDILGRQIHDALAHLYDLSYLQTHPLAPLVCREPSAHPVSIGKVVRQALLDAIETLRPLPPEPPAGSRGWRAYRLLTWRYVEACAVPEVCRLLGISEREYYRIHQRGIVAVVAAVRKRWELDEGPIAESRRPPSADLPEPGQSPPGPRRPLTNLPVPLTSFVGRERETVEVAGWLRRSRLLTLTGAGGCGKTRLALAVAAELSDEFPDGVWLVELAPLSDPDLVTKAVAIPLGVREQPGQPIRESLRSYLASKSVLLVLDNCEHLVDACARLAEDLLQACLGVRILATSREALRAAGEVVWRVPSLSAVDPDHLPLTTTELKAALRESEAARLFVERAAAGSPGFEINGANARAVAKICWHLGGIPLALELAAARIRGLSIEQIAARLSDRFDLLTSGRRTALARHQSLRAAIDWSYDLLTEPERLVFRRLTVFSGGFTLEAAEAVCQGGGIQTSEVLDLLLRLVDRSLVMAGGEENETRYRLLETIRQYAEEKLLTSGEVTSVRARHLDWYLTLAERAAPELAYGPDQRTWLDRLQIEHDNLRGALEWCQARDEDPGALDRLAAALGAFWYRIDNHAEARERLERVLHRPVHEPRSRAVVLQYAGLEASLHGDWARAREWYAESLARSREIGDKRLIARALFHLSFMSGDLGNLAEARSLREEALAVARESGDRHTIANMLENLADVLCLQDENAAARPLFEESLTISRILGYPEGMCSALTGLGRVALAEGDYRKAGAFFEPCLVQAREGDLRHLAAVALIAIGDLARAEGDYDAALSHCQQALVIWQEIGIRLLMVSAITRIAGLSGAREQSARAARLFAAMHAWHEAMGIPKLYRPHPGYQQDEAAAREALGDEAFARAWAEGQAMTLEQAAAYALEDDE
jgi:predicted ATPase